MKIMITGGAGFIGSQIGWFLSNRGHEITLLDNMSYGHEDNLTIDGKQIGTFIEDDIRSEDFDKHVAGMDAVIHLAGIAPLPDCQTSPYWAYDNNVGGTLNVFESCRKNNISKVIFASTSAVYENCSNMPFVEEIVEKEPDLIYPMTKRNCEWICKSYSDNYGLDIVTLRFFNTYGPHQDFKRKHPPLMGYITKCLLENTNPTFHSDGHQKRDYIYVDDISRMVEIILSKDSLSGEVFNVSSGNSFSVRDIYEVYQEKFDINLPATFQEAEKFWDRYPELYEGSNPLSKDRLVKEVNKSSVGSYSKAEKILGWTPQVSLEDGIRACVDYAKKIKGSQ